MEHVTGRRPSPSRDAFTTAAVVGGTNALLAAALAVAVRSSWGRATPQPRGWESAIGTVTLACGVGMVLTCLLLRLPQRRPVTQVTGTVALAATFGGVRTLVSEAVLPLAAQLDAGPVSLWVFSTGAYLVVAGPALLVSTLDARRGAEHEARLSEQEQHRTTTAALEQDEVELRQHVAAHLHGAVQNRLVVVSVGLEHLAEESEAERRPDRAAALREWAHVIDTVRERDVRAISHRVFPTGLDLGLVQALSTLLDRLPTSVATSFRVTERAHEGDQDVPVADRLIVAACVEEGLTNALRHGGATRVDLGLDLAGSTVRAVLDDDGVGLPGSVRESGLLGHRARIESRGGRVDLAGRDRGARLTIELPLA